MRNKSGQFFGLYLVFILLFSCGVVIYDVLKKDASNSMVSPSVVLEVRDDLELFEMREVDLIKSSLVEVNKVEVFGTEDFMNEFRRVFIEGVLADDRMKEFVFSNLTLGGRGVEDEARLRGRNFFENGLYSEGLTEFESGNLVFGREVIGKEMYLKAKDKYKINFPVDFSFEFSRKYLISFNDGEFEVGVE